MLRHNDRIGASAGAGVGGRALRLNPFEISWKSIPVKNHTALPIRRVFSSTSRPPSTGVQRGAEVQIVGRRGGGGGGGRGGRAAHKWCCPAHAAFGGSGAKAAQGTKSGKTVKRPHVSECNRPKMAPVSYTEAPGFLSERLKDRSQLPLDSSTSSSSVGMLWQGSCGGATGAVGGGGGGGTGGSVGQDSHEGVSSPRKGRAPGRGRSAIPAKSCVRLVQYVLMKRFGGCTSTFDTAAPRVQVQVNAHRYKSQLQHSCSIFLAHESGTCAGID